MPMPTIPSVSEIRARIISDIEGEIGQTTPFLPKAFNKVIAGALAGIVILLYQAILWVYNQIFPETADYNALILLGKLVNITPTTANHAVITANIFGTTGESVLSGTTLFKSDAGTIFKVTAGGIIAGGFVLCTLESQTTGDGANVADGEILSIITADPVLTGSATVIGTTTEGADAETEASFRARVIARYKKRKTGGSPADYELWGLEAPHFIWVSPVAGNEPGVIWIYGEVDNQTDGIPTAGQLITLKDYLTNDPESGLATRKPIGDELVTLPISRKVFDFAIRIKDGTTNIKADITTALGEYLLSLSPYNEGVTLLRDDAITDTGASSAANDVARDGGAAIIQLIVKENSTGSPVSSYMLCGGEKAKIGTVTYTDVI